MRCKGESGMRRFGRARAAGALSAVLAGFAWATSAVAEGQVDVTAKVREAVKEHALSMAVENGTLGDPQPGDAKKLMVEFKLGDVVGKKAVAEHGVLEIKGSADKPLTIIRAVYGVEGGDLSSVPVPEPMAYGATTSFRPTAKWLDDGGVHISGHGGGMLYHKKVYYWYGENRTRGKDGGVRCYSSANLSSRTARTRATRRSSSMTTARRITSARRKGTGPCTSPS
ncbi:MAG: hypothetical protein WCK89_07710 [bacterium]